LSEFQINDFPVEICFCVVPFQNYFHIISSIFIHDSPEVSSILKRALFHFIAYPKLFLNLFSKIQLTSFNYFIFTTLISRSLLQSLGCPLSSNLFRLNHY